MIKYLLYKENISDKFFMNFINMIKLIKNTKNSLSLDFKTSNKI